MKTLKDLPKDTDITKVKVRLSNFLYDYSSLQMFGAIKSREVYLVGPQMGDWFVKLHIEDSIIHPLFRDFISWDELKDLKVIE